MNSRAPSVVPGLGAATTSLWNSVNGGLIEMMGAVQHNFVQDLEDIQRLNQQWQAESAEEANFDDIINGQQVVEDPNTGQLFEAPYGADNPAGPDGGGYYRALGQRDGTGPVLMRPGPRFIWAVGAPSSRPAYVSD